MKDNNNPLPLFITDPERRSLSVRIGINPEFIHSINQNRYEDQDAMSLRERIIAFLATGAMSKRDLSEKLGYKGISPNINKVVDELNEKGIVIKEGKGRGSKLRLNLKR